MKYIFFTTQLLLITLVINAQNYNQSVEDFAEGKWYTNQSTGRSIKYGYISSLNTNGLTFKDSEGYLAYFMNCSKEFSRDKQYMELSFCMSPVTGGTLNKIGVYKNRIIWYATDENLTFYLEENEEYGNSNNSVSSQSNTNSNVIGKPKKIGTLEIAQKDFSSALTYTEAVTACIELGDGWRLPTNLELKLMYNNRSIIGGFNSKNYYWGTDKEDNFIQFAFFNGTSSKFNSFIMGQGAKFNVRAVRTKSK